MTPGRNDPCLCGSGKKYKVCCLETDQLDAARQRLLANAAGVVVAGQWTLEQLHLLDEAAAVLQRAMALTRERGGELARRGPEALTLWLEISPMFREGARQLRAVDLRRVFIPAQRDGQALARSADRMAGLVEVVASAISSGQPKIAEDNFHLMAREAELITRTLERLEAGVIDGNRVISEQTERIHNQAARMQRGGANHKGG